ncbi:microtubule-associated protein 10 [Perognathus longimembris pacificus]|uniref:microtubule-associated protein 10 n=1 Tax=Perognathus longimembris pacificus TaxID=214514 RepID=UPI0020191C16|nr:microtubule-associated protein 10 [Perognathus longimembris pacificus]
MAAGVAAAAAAERLFSLELLVDWVRLEAAPPPRAPGPALAFRLLDFPPLLVRAPPAAAAAAARPPPARRGAIGFGRGKACVFRLRPAALRRPRLRAALLLPPPPPAGPGLLGTCDIPLAAPAPGGRRGTFALRSPAGRRVGDLALFYRLRDLGPPGPGSAPDDGTHRPARRGDPPGSPPGTPGAELESAVNTFCPPPLYYTRRPRGKAPPAPAQITLEPGGLGAEDAEPASPPSPRPPRPPPPPEGAPGPPRAQPPPRAPPPPADALRQLPLLNALLTELSLLCRPPAPGPAPGPHPAWTDRTPVPRRPEPRGDPRPLGGSEERSPPRPQQGRAPGSGRGGRGRGAGRGRLLYGLTHTLRLRLRQTNPDMLAVHEKREQDRKRRARAAGAGLRAPSCKAGPPSWAEHSQRPRTLPGDRPSDARPSRPVGRVPGEPSTDPSQGRAEPAALRPGDLRRGGGPSGSALSPAGSTASERRVPPSPWGTSDLEGQSPCIFPQDAAGEIVGREVNHGQVIKPWTDNRSQSAAATDGTPSNRNCYADALECEYSDDFTSPCYSEDFHTPEDSSRSVQAHSHGGAGVTGQTHRACPRKPREARLPPRQSGSEESSLLSPPFSAGSPVPSHKRPHSKTPDRSTEDASSISSSDVASSSWTKKGEKHVDQTSTCTSKTVRTGKDVSIRRKAGAGRKCADKSQSPRTSQVSSYLPSNLSELELKDLESGSSDHFDEDDDGLCSLNTSKQYRDICELVINKLPGYTV